MNPSSVAPAILFFLILLGVGITCVFQPKKVQAWAARSADTGITGRATFLLRYIRSAQYIVTLRMLGLACLGCCTFAVWLAVRSYL